VFVFCGNHQGKNSMGPSFSQSASSPVWWSAHLLDSQMKMGAMSSRGFTTSKEPSACFFSVGTGIPGSLPSGREQWFRAIEGIQDGTLQ